jgi:hypothetical protein
MKAKRIFTGSAETEAQLAKHLALVDSPDAGAPVSAFADDDYMLEVMITGRAGPGQARQRSEAPDDIGGFFDVRGSEVFLTAKALECISF